MRTTGITVASLVMFGASAWAGEPWWNADWTARQQVYLNNTVLAEDLKDFPVTLRLTSANFDFSKAAKDGRDVRAVAMDGTLLPLEIARWTPESAMLVIQMPLITTTPGQSIFLYYGNPKAPALTAQKPYDAQYRAVLHFNGNLKDATGRTDATEVVGNVKIGQGAEFSGVQGSFVRLDPKALKGIGEQLTVAVRFRPDKAPAMQCLVSGASQTKDWFNFGMRVPDLLHTNTAHVDRVGAELNINAPLVDQWHSAVIRYDARNNARAICLDGRELHNDGGLTGTFPITELRIGDGVLHFESWQFNGTIDEVRIQDSARSDSWIKAEAAGLADKNTFAVIGRTQAYGEPAPPLPAFDLDMPADNLSWRKRNTPLTLSWDLCLGASNYTVLLAEDAAMSKIIATIDAKAATSIDLTEQIAVGKPVYWTVEASNPAGKVRATSVRSFTMYDWSRSTLNEEHGDVTPPALGTASHAEFDLQGYLRGRIDRTIENYYISTPETSPAILQVLRDRDKRPLRESLMPWAGEFAGKYLTGAVLSWRLTHNEELKKVIDQFAKDLIACQAENGYFGPFPKDTRLTGRNWDIWGHYHSMYGLMLYYEDTQYEPALTACKKAADLLFETFGPGGPTLTNDDGAGSMNMSVCHALVLLYKKTGEQRYLDLAKYVVHDAWNEPGAGRWLESALASKPLTEFPQHRWECIHSWQALAELYWLTGDEQYKKAFEHIWREGTAQDRHNTGGVTSGEGFQGTPYNTGAIETCCTVAWAAMSFDMLRMTGDSKVADELEWSTLNSALAAIPYGGRVCAYNVPMDGTRCFGVELPWQAPRAGADLNCCAVNAGRPLGMISEWALMQKGSALFVNYYGPGEMSATLPSGNTVRLTQETTYPVDARVTMKVRAKRAETFPLNLRIPVWSRTTTVNVNGEAVANVQPGTYLTLERKWKHGDVVTLTFDFTPQFWRGEAGYGGQVSIYRGPLLYTYDARYTDLNPDQVPAIDWKTVSMEPAKWDGPIAPWSLMTLKTADGVALPVVDLSSAGQTGNQYRSWLPAKGDPSTDDKTAYWRR